MSFEPQKVIDAERGVIGSILIDNRVMDEVVTMLEPRDFSCFAHEMIWKAIHHMYENDKPVDLITLTEMLVTYKRLDEIGGVPYLQEILSGTITAANAKYYAEIVRKRSIQQRVAEVGEKIRNLAIEQEFESEEDLFRRIEQLSDSVRPSMKNKLVPPDETRKGYMDYLRAKDDLILTGFPKFDEWMGGIGRGWLYILAGRPSAGKTAKMLQMAYQMARQKKGIVAIFSQEMKRESLYNRMISSMTNITSTRFRLKKLNADEFEKVEKAFDEIERLQIHIADAGSISIDEVRAETRQLKRRHGKLGAIFIDYLGAMDIPQPRGMTLAQAMGKVSRKAKDLAMELDCPLVMLAQMNREGEKSIKPSLMHLRDSGNVEQDADVVEFLWMNYDDKDAGPHHGATVVQSLIAKGREVGVNEFRYAFKGWIQQFCELPQLPKK